MARPSLARPSLARPRDVAPPSSRRQVRTRLAAGGVVVASIRSRRPVPPQSGSGGVVSLTRPLEHAVMKVLGQVRHVALVIGVGLAAACSPPVPPGPGLGGATSSPASSTPPDPVASSASPATPAPTPTRHGCFVPGSARPTRARIDVCAGRGCTSDVPVHAGQHQWSERVGGANLDPGPARAERQMRARDRLRPRNPWPRAVIACVTVRLAPAGIDKYLHDGSPPPHERNNTLHYARPARAGTT